MAGITAFYRIGAGSNFAKTEISILIGGCCDRFFYQRKRSAGKGLARISIYYLTTYFTRLRKSCVGNNEKEKEKNYYSHKTSFGKGKRLLPL
jgi:hypothetical protein